MSRHEYRKYWHCAKAKNIVLLAADISDYLCPRHSHAGYCVCAVEKGGLKINYENINIEAFRGDLLFFNPGVAHDGCAWSFKEGCQYRTLEIDKFLMDCFFKDKFGDITEKYRFGVLLKHMPQEANEFIRMHKKMESLRDITGTDDILVDIREIILGTQNIIKIEIQKKDILVEDIKKFIDQKYSSDLKIDYIASIFNISPFYMCREFKKFFGLSLHAYINQKRIHRALELLKHDSDMSQIALEIGFNDQSHFIRVFKSILGVTPARYKFGKKQNINYETEEDVS